MMILQIIIIALCLGYIEYVYFTDIRPDKVVTNTFNKTQCELADKNLGALSRMTNSYRANFLVKYTVDGKNYNQWVSGNGLNFSYVPSKDEEVNILNQYQVGKSYQCWYNPKMPQEAVLVLRNDWTSTLPLFLPSIIILIVLYYLLRSIYHLLRVKKP